MPYDNRYVAADQKKIKFNLQKGLERRSHGAPLLADKKVRKCGKVENSILSCMDRLS